MSRWLRPAPAPRGVGSVSRAGAAQQDGLGPRDRREDSAQRSEHHAEGDPQASGQAATPGAQPPDSLLG